MGGHAVLTGLTASFDRMLHLTAYARALKEGMIVVAGGPSVRALPRRAQRFFDYACLGDIEQLQAIIRETLGADYVAEQPFPRFDLIPRPHPRLRGVKPILQFSLQLLFAHRRT